MCAPTPPTPPDPAKTAAAQTQSNRETAITQQNLNSVNQVTPQGTLTYKQIGTWEDGTPRYEATTAYSPEQQALYDQSTATATKLGALGGSQVDKLTGLLGTNVDLSAENIDKYSNTHFADDFNRQWDRDLSRLDNTLANKGIKQGSTAYTNALGDFSAAKANAFDNLLGNMTDSSRSAILSERNQPINEITALLSGSQVSKPSFGSTPQTGIEGTDVAGITQTGYQNQLGQYNNQVSQNNALWGGLSSLGSSLISGGWALSDEDAKKDIRKVGEIDDDVNLYSFKYKPGMGKSGLSRLGVMAQEVEKVDPAAVTTGRDGFKRVNYDRVLARA